MAKKTIVMMAFNFDIGVWFGHPCHAPHFCRWEMFYPYHDFIMSFEFSTVQLNPFPDQKLVFSLALFIDGENWKVLGYG
jgi:hypothetical protein